MKTFDVVVIGAGPGGYVAAIRCAQLGLETACIDAWRTPRGEPALGGTCLNVGCIPSKALLDSSHHYASLKHLLPQHGITVSDPNIDIAVMQARKDRVVERLTSGIAMLFRKNKVTWLTGHGALAGEQRVAVTQHGDNASEVIAAKDIIIATGSVPLELAGIAVDHTSVVDSSGALAFQSAPPRLGIIGAGVIGLELGSVWNRLGSEVVLLEALEEFLPPVDRQVAKEAYKSLTGQGLDIRLGVRVTSAHADSREVTVEYVDKNEAQAIKVDKLIVAVGRSAFTQGLNLEAVGVELDDRGCIKVDDDCRTNVSGIYAIGDVVRGPMLAHKASEEGIAVAERLAGQAGHVDYGIIPWVIYTHPEIAWVGKTQAAVESAGRPYRTGSFRLSGLGRAHAAGETEGLVKIIADARTDSIEGVHILGTQASELIAEAVTAMAFHASAEDLARTVHAHPTLAEAIHEAALDVDERALHR
ncbi:MAG: dihydrolipoyl dehydrogenase [Gammaproteobacteria bacterium]|jgi:dihydrolipoamide dehydrogenase